MFSLGDLRHPHAGLADRRRGRSPAPAPSTPPARSARSAASSRRSSPPATPAPSCSWCRPDNCDEAIGAPNGDMRLVRAQHHARGARADRGLGRRPDAALPDLRRRRRMSDRMTDSELTPETAADPALAAAVLEIETHVAEAGWDQPVAALRAGRHRRAGRPGAGARRRDGPRRPPGGGSLTPVEQERSAPTSRSRRLLQRDRLARHGRAGAPPSSSGWCCRRGPTPSSPTTGGSGGVRPRAPGPPGGPDRRGRDPRRGDVLCVAAAGPRRRPVRGRPAPTWCLVCWSWWSTTLTEEADGRVVSELFDEPAPAAAPPRRRLAPVPRAVVTAVILVVGFIALSTFASLWTERLWFGSVGYGEVFSTLLWTRVRAVPGLRRADGRVPSALNIALAYRFRPVFRPTSPEQVGLDRYREAVVPDPRAGWWSALPLVIGLFAGTSADRGVAHLSAVAQRRSRSAPTTPTSTRTSASTSSTCRGCTTWSTSLMAVAVVVAAGGRRRPLPLRRHPAAEPRATGSSGARRCSSRCCSGCSCWPRRSTTGSTASTWSTTPATAVTGINYTDDNAMLPAKNILTWIAVICAVLFFVNVWRRTWMLPVGRPGAARALGDPARPDLAGHRPAVPGQPDARPTRRRRTSRRTSTPRGRRTTSTTW